jgi:hypothetical protein
MALIQLPALSRGLHVTPDFAPVHHVQARFWEVVTAASVVFGYTIASTALLLQAGMPLHYHPIPVRVHVSKGTGHLRGRFCRLVTRKGLKVFRRAWRVRLLGCYLCLVGPTGYSSLGACHH